MVSTPTTRVRLEKQGLGDNLNAWGSVNLNAALDRIDEALAGVQAITISGAATTLTSTNYATDEARKAVLVLTGTLAANSTIAVPNVEKSYLVINNTTMGAYSLTIKTAAGSGYALRTGPQSVYCDATDVYRATPRVDQAPVAGADVAVGGYKITGLGTPTASTDAATKGYVDTASLGALAAGSAATPAFRFSSDTDTGMYSAAADQLAFATGGAERARLNSAGTLELTVSANGGLSVTGPSYSGQFVSSSLGGMALVSSGAYPLIFYVNGSERASINSAGTLTIPKSSGSHIVLNEQGGITAQAMVFQFGGVSKGNIDVSSAGVTYNTVSDYRLKTDVEPLGHAIDRLVLLRPKRFRWKSDGEGAEKVDGFLAHEVGSVVREAVTGEKDGDAMQTMDASRLIPLLVAAVHELVDRVEYLEEQA